jgi:hypothetical protein
MKAAGERFDFLQDNLVMTVWLSLNEHLLITPYPPGDIRATVFF